MSMEKYMKNKCNPIYKSAIGLVFIIFFSNSYSQTSNFQEIEKKSYDYYFRQQWDSLIMFNEKQIKSGNDYFYIRTRTGIAYYMEGQYKDAVLQLEKAYSFNSQDSINTQYLYLGYLNSGRFLEAWNLEKKNSKQLKSLAKKTNPGYYQSYWDGGIINSNNFAKNSPKLQMHKDSIYAEKDLYGRMKYANVLFTRPILSFANITIGAGYLNVQKRKSANYYIIEKSGYDTILLDPGYYLDTVYLKNIRNISKDYPLNQFQMYISSSFLLGHGYKVVGGFSLLKTNYKVFNTVYSIESYFAQSYDTILSSKTVYSFPETDTSFINFAGSLGLFKDIGRFQAGISAGFSGLNNKRQLYSSISLNFYPEGNLDSYLLGELTIFKEQSETNMIIHLIAGKKILKKTWADINCSVGKMKNFSEKNAYLIFNSGDETYLKAGAGLIFSVNNRLNIYLRTVASLNRGNYFNIKNDNTYRYYQFHYQNINYTGGLLWKI